MAKENLQVTENELNALNEDGYDLNAVSQNFMLLSLPAPMSPEMELQQKMLRMMEERMDCGEAPPPGPDFLDSLGGAQ